jgi:hypothetical protein
MQSILYTARTGVLGSLVRRVWLQDVHDASHCPHLSALRDPLLLRVWWTGTGTVLTVWTGTCTVITVCVMLVTLCTSLCSMERSTSQNTVDRYLYCNNCVRDASHSLYISVLYGTLYFSEHGGQVPVLTVCLVSNYLSFGCVCPFVLGLFGPPGSGSRRPSSADTDPRHCYLPSSFFFLSSSIKLIRVLQGLHSVNWLCNFCSNFLFFLAAQSACSAPLFRRRFD